MYAYAGGDPLNFNDPDGLLRCGDIPGENASGPTGRTFEDILDTTTDYRSDPSGLDASCGWVWTSDGAIYIPCPSGNAPGGGPHDGPVPQDPPGDPGSGPGGDSHYWNGMQAAGATTAVMRPILKEELGRLSSDCYAAINDATGISAAQLGSAANNLQFYDTRGAAGQLTCSDIVPGNFGQAGQITLQAYGVQGGGDASVVTYYDAKKNFVQSTNVLLNAGFWSQNGDDPLLVLVHELLHYSTQSDDPSLAGKLGVAGTGNDSKAISDWLADKCGNR
jgi:hypothetical protein